MNDPMGSLAAFDVIDKTTGQKPDLRKMALEEDWVKNAGLIYCDMDGFMLDQDGNLYLIDDCNTMVPCPAGRFEVKWRNLAKRSEYVLANNPRSAGIYLQLGSYTWCADLNRIRKKLKEYKEVDPDFEHNKIYQLMFGAVEVE